MKKNSWKFKVVKMMRGMQGQWFAFPTAATFPTEGEAREYAEQFAADQREAGIRTARYTVRTRGNRLVSEIRI